MTSLKVLAEARGEILKAEVASLLHNIGKLSDAFLSNQRVQARKDKSMEPLPTDVAFENFNFRVVAGMVDYYVTERNVSIDKSDRLKTYSQSWSDSTTNSLLPAEFRERLRKPNISLPEPLNDCTYAVGDFIEFHLLRWYGPLGAQDFSLLGRSSSKATELLAVAHHEASGRDKEAQTQDLDPQTEIPTYRATVFGHEVAILDNLLDRKRECLIKAISSGDSTSVIPIAHETMRVGLGDTRRPINDVTLWDLSHSTSALFKSAVAQVILQGWPALPPHENICWRLLYVSFDGLNFWGQAHRFTDLLGRRKALEDGLDAVRNVLEVEYPLGNEIYRDENGSVFIVPDMPGLLELTENGKSLKKILEEAFEGEETEETSALWSEVVPEIDIYPSQDKPAGLRDDDLGRGMARVLRDRGRANVPDPNMTDTWWLASHSPDNAEICTVCGQRPMGFPKEGSDLEKGLSGWAIQKNAQERGICRVCLRRRGRRAKDWARNVRDDQNHNPEEGDGESSGPFERTIWVEEVADDNGRVALVVGRFILDGWIDGKLMPTIGKPVSFARIHRCWDTTHRFCLDVQNRVIPEKLDKRTRLAIRPSNADELSDPAPDKGLGKWHAYDIELTRQQRLGVCWDPNDEKLKDRNVLWTTTNLVYEASQLGIEVHERPAEEVIADLKGHVQDKCLKIYKPGSYLQKRKEKARAEECKIVDKKCFSPFIPIAAEPAIFMALVPADKAFEVAKAIKAKYDCEMGRVRDRLPLHLGLVFAPRRTPVSALLDAGRAMLNIPANWEKWQVEVAGNTATFSKEKGASFRWKYPEKMGDNNTKDAWYSRLLKSDPGKSMLEAGDFRHIDKIPSNTKEKAYIRPSRFDFEFLDSTARRFEIRYNPETGRRRRPTRPFLLDDLGRLECLWKELCKLEKSQRYQVIATIEAAREQWFEEDPGGRSQDDKVLRQFVHDTLARAAWPRNHKWSAMPEHRRCQLIEAGTAGELADWAELHMHILKE